MKLFKEDALFIKSNVKLVSSGKAENFYQKYAQEFGCIPTSVSQLLIDSLGANKLIALHASKINHHSFEDCVGLIDITIPGRIKVIEDGAFANSDITILSLNSGVTTLGSSAFNGCTDLTSVFLPKSISYIDNYCFYNCPNLYEIYYEGTFEEFNKIQIKPTWIGRQKISLYCEDKGVTL